MNKQKVIIFCQASADVLYTLDLISRNQSSIVYSNRTHSTNYFFKSLNIPEVEFSEMPSIRFNFSNPFSIIFARLSFLKILKTSFYLENCRVYFFSTSYDWLTAGIVKHLSNKNEVFYYNHYDYNTALCEEYDFSIVREVKTVIYRYITRANYISKSETNFPKFDVKGYKITEVTGLQRPKLNEEYLFRLRGPKLKIVLFLSQVELGWLSDLARRDFLNFLQKLADSGYAVYLKNHPRMSNIPNLEFYIEDEIPKYVPGEFIDFSDVYAVIGFTSTSLVHPAVLNYCYVFSLLQKFKFRDEKLINENMMYLNSFNQDISFSFESLENHLFGNDNNLQNMDLSS